MPKEREACGRCSTSIALEAVTEGEDDGGNGDERAGRDLFGPERIEVDEGRLRSLSPDGWMDRVSSRLDTAVERLTWGR
ncbi:hypothetical protein [Halopiger aswanensis]|uniref:Uncharacterized protein n=1 Tax=Halopiger aswanensis TaxID=148449 RepID=A0A3R7KNV3_9EURY|nr:hypothetical protein [Halopiger aswanensis]RKD98211.1 hypothetical protein ATJ93_1216 [Halopiger aswanensis]